MPAAEHPVGETERELPCRRGLVVDHHTRVGEQREPGAALDLLPDERCEEDSGRKKHQDEPREPPAAEDESDHPDDEKSGDEGGSAGDGRCGDEGGHAGRRPGPRRRESRVEQPRQEQVGEDGGRTTRLHRDEQRRCDGPRERGEHPQARALGQAGCQHPRTESGQRKRNEVERDQEERGLPEGERSEHGEHCGERVGRTDEAEPDIAPAVSERRPEVRDVRRHRQERSAAEGVRSEKGEEQCDAEQSGREYRPAAAPAEEVEVAAFAPERHVRGLALQRARAAHFGDRDAQGCDRSPADDTMPGEVAPGAADPDSSEHGSECSRELTDDRTGLLADDAPDRPEEGERYRREPGG